MSTKPEGIGDGYARIAPVGSRVTCEPAWPFQKSVPTEAPPQSVTATRTPAQSRTARGREKTKAAIAAGAAAKGA